MSFSEVNATLYIVYRLLNTCLLDVETLIEQLHETGYRFKLHFILQYVYLPRKHWQYKVTTWGRVRFRGRFRVSA